MVEALIRLTIGSLAILGASVVNAQPAPRLPAGLSSAREMIRVTTPDWDATTGILERFERESAEAPWHTVGAPIPIVVGRTGLAWDTGFDNVASVDANAPRKHEGDGKSPAGVFPLDTVFGFAPVDSMKMLRMPYVMLTPSSDCVDDTTSSHYNTVISRDVVHAVDWASAEHMRQIEQYRLGVIVGYNAAPPIKGRGSCIFLHIWGGPSSTTAGCTAMDASALEEVVAWLDHRKRPVLVQLPSVEYARLRASWKLPALR